jgi:hypothetical protein
MKNTIILTSLAFALALASTQDTQAQGLLGKLKEKVGQAGTDGFGGGDTDWNGFPVANAKGGQKDIENNKLDGMTFTADKLGVSGIYIAQKPIAFLQDNKLDKTVQKFLIELSSDGLNLKLRHNANNDYYKPYDFVPVSEHVETHRKVNREFASKGVYFGYENSTREAGYQSARYTDDVQYEGKAAKYGVALEYLSLLEPGVFVFHKLVSPKNGVTTCEGGSQIVGEEKPTNWDYITFNLLVKKGKDASKWTNDAIVKELKRQSDVKCSLILAGNAANAKMPEKVTGFKDEPSNADLLKAAQARAKQYGWKETVTAVYPTASWTNKYKLLGVNQLNTLVSRQMEINVIMKTPKGECAIETMLIEQDNVFTTGSTDEKFAGKPVYAAGNGNLTPIDCSKTKK